MEKLSKNELTQLADSFLILAQIVGDFRIKYYSKLDAAMQDRIRIHHKSLIDCADTFYAASVTVIVEDARQVLAKIQQMTTDLKKSVKKVKKVQDILNAMGAATNTGTALMGKNPLAITASLAELGRTFEKLKTSSKN